MKKIYYILLLMAVALPCLAQQTFDRSKMSDYLCSLVNMQHAYRVKSTKVSSQKVTALMKLNDDACLQAVEKEFNIHVLDSIGDIYIVNIPIITLGKLSLDSRVQRLEAHEMPTACTDEVPQRVGADKAWGCMELPQAYTGKGVISGVLDTGFDFTHPMFYDMNGDCRIVQYFDMVDCQENEGQCEVYNTEELINKQHSGLTSTSHGTFVASIMVGSTVSSNTKSYSGIAKESDIVLAEIRNNTSWKFDGNEITIDGSSANFILAIKRIFDYADEQSKPCVINYSAGYPMPITDPCVLENEAISVLLKSGHILVAASGNDAMWPTTIKKTADMEEVSVIYGEDGLGWYGTLQRFTPVLEHYMVSEHPQTITFFNKSDTISFSTDTLDILADEKFFMEKFLNPGDPDDGTLYIIANKVMNVPPYVKGQLYQFLIGVNSSIWTSMGHYLYRFDSSLSIMGSSSCEVYTNPKFNRFENVSNDCLSREYTISWPASHNDVIAVGSLKKKLLYSFETSYLSSFSSQGPNWEHQIKPDVVAVGESVHVAYNEFSDSCESDKSKFYDTLIRNDSRDHYMDTASGTSMSSPVVAGAIAIWLQAKPDLTPKDIKNVLAATCKHPEKGIEYPNNQYGYGEIDVYAGLLYILDIPNKISELSEYQPLSAKFRFDGHRLTVVQMDTGLPIEDEATLTVYTTNGQKVATAKGNTIDLSALSSGIYVVQLNSRKKEILGSTLIRL